MLLELPFGTLRYYHSRKEIVAHCAAHGEQRRLSRTVVGTVGKPARGRPVGLLAAWLYNAYDPGNDSGYFHVHAKPLPTLQQRQDARGVVATVAASGNLFGKERRRFGGVGAGGT